MYVILVYDVGVERVNRVRKFLRKYMIWIQNSVFEGELSEAELTIIKHELREIIDPDEDAIVIYKLKNQKNLKREEMGTPKATIDNII